MCDTFVATPDSTSSGKMIFGKNSDREPNEPQCLVRFPEKIYKESIQRLTFIDVPSSKKSREILISRPLHIWGAEMGANSKGVVIGNEAIFTKIRIEKKNDGLTGMDLLRLGLERSDTAAEAKDLIIEYLERFGQDACGGYSNRNFFYHNSFIIADPKEAYVLETADRYWAWKKIKGFYAISNGLTLGSDYDGLHSHAIDFARAKGWLKKGQTFSFKDAFSDSLFTSFSKCKVRREIVTGGGKFFGSKLGVSEAMQILRLEGKEKGSVPLTISQGGFPSKSIGFSPVRSGMGSVCLHAGGPFSPNQTTSSFVAELDTNPINSQFWATGCSIPSLSIFIPFSIPGKTFLEGDIIQPGTNPDSSLWWNHEILYRLCLKNYDKAVSVFNAELKEKQEKYIRKVEYTLNLSRNLSLDPITKEAAEEADKLYRKWRTQVLELAVSDGLLPNFWSSPLYNLSWAIWNRKARINSRVLKGTDLPYEPAYL
ncbi:MULTISPECIES: acyl-CoA--6-aminopenicillanic acid acyltransferase [unclassified Leptospira]|uniref:acyl-CoA--6-aminopenicillanic acid acyltransferase n=1 Tax=unclassified Leptospira TaxID=2633828 RepID=UPI0002BE7405|nr:MULTISPECIES: acyl-CoA--6-aminopenicillanic acid acyltransferase [unclassified Leptospira]EMJ97138.1 acyl-coenzyme A:6-aminopenicillanic acid acyl-transferase domain protein [Leptospira sp. B5-022]MCR1795422.1 acyl-CoA--6-aminopenicillanic acid acyltransferase [Leptospira sp. id769339]